METGTVVVSAWYSESSTTVEEISQVPVPEVIVTSPVHLSTEQAVEAPAE